MKMKYPITKTKDSFGRLLYKVEYFRMGKKTAKTFYTEAEAENFANRGVNMLANEPICKTRKDRRRNRAVPSW